MPGVHVHCQETVLHIHDGLPKLKDVLRRNLGFRLGPGPGRMTARRVAWMIDLSEQAGARHPGAGLHGAGAVRRHDRLRCGATVIARRSGSWSPAATRRASSGWRGGWTCCSPTVSQCTDSPRSMAVKRDHFAAASGITRADPEDRRRPQLACAMAAAPIAAARRSGVAPARSARRQRGGRCAQKRASTYSAARGAQIA